MSNTRREFLVAGSAALAGGVISRLQASEETAAPQVPKMKFFNAEISRVVLGVNPFYGFAHFNNNFGASMKEWYTSERVCDVMRRSAACGINAFNYVHLDRAPQDWARFTSAGRRYVSFWLRGRIIAASPLRPSMQISKG
jgi:hypothetical protein